MRLFDPGDPEPIPEKASYTVRLTKRRLNLLAAGIHPTTRKPLLVGSEGCCGTCEHHFAHDRHPRTYHKCKLAKGGLTSGPASDVRVGWPACELYQEMS